MAATSAGARPFFFTTFIVLISLALSSTAPSESWGDDFAFERANDPSNAPIPESDDPHWSLSTSNQDWHPDSRPISTLSQLDTLQPAVRLQEWAEPGPSTPPRHAVAHPENWDDDFEDKNSPAHQPPSRSHHKSSKLPDIPEPENWDDDLDANKFVSPRKDHAWDSSDDDEGIDEEDKTVTAHPRKGLLSKHSPPPPVPSLPLPLESVGETFPGSPTLSVFSISPSGRESVNTYSSLAHLPLRGGNTSARAMLHPSPPQKGRRRLRKKSRPPDNNVFELLDRRRDIAPLPSPPQPSSPNQGLIDLPPSEASNSSRSSILSRLGSVKRWGVRKRFTSPGPGDSPEGEQAERDATPRAAVSRARSPSRTPSWFFRSSAGTPDSTPGDSPSGSTPLELKPERSFRQLRAFVTAVDSPTKKGKLPGSILGERPRDSGSASTPDGSPPSSPRRPRRPKSMQVNAMATPSRAPRHASYGARSISRSTSHTSTEDITGETQGGSKEKEKEKDGHRGFMSGVRRISLVSGKKHKRTKSTTTVADDTDELQSSSSIPQTPPPAMPMAMAPSISSQLLPPIELQPPSPPRDQEPDRARRSMASERSVISTSGSLAAGVESLLLQPSVDSRSMSSPPSTITPRPSPSKSPGSPQAASLGRATQPPPVSVATGIVPRRNSLGDLKIPARISQAQVGLKRDLGMVREFAAEVESEFRNPPLIIACGLKLSQKVSKSSRAFISPSLLKLKPFFSSVADIIHPVPHLRHSSICLVPVPGCDQTLAQILPSSPLVSKSNFPRRSSIWTISTKFPGNALSYSSSLAVVHQRPRHSRTRLCRQPRSSLCNMVTPLAVEEVASAP